MDALMLLSGVRTPSPISGVTLYGQNQDSQWHQLFPLGLVPGKGKSKDLGIRGVVIEHFFHLNKGGKKTPACSIP